MKQIRNPVTGNYYSIRECSSKFETRQSIVLDEHCAGCAFQKYAKYKDHYICCPVEEKQLNMICCQRYKHDSNYWLKIKLKKFNV